MHILNLDPVCITVRTGTPGWNKLGLSPWGSSQCGGVGDWFINGHSPGQGMTDYGPWDPSQPATSLCVAHELRMSSFFLSWDFFILESTQTWVQELGEEQRRRNSSRFWLSAELHEGVGLHPMTLRLWPDRKSRAPWLNNWAIQVPQAENDFCKAERKHRWVMGSPTTVYLCVCVSGQGGAFVWPFRWWPRVLWVRTAVGPQATRTQLNLTGEVRESAPSRRAARANIWYLSLIGLQVYQVSYYPSLIFFSFKI